jgi:hypothetical protein
MKLASGQHSSSDVAGYAEGMEDRGTKSVGGRVRHVIP